MCHKNNEVLWLRLLRRGGGGEEGVGEGGGGRGEEKEGGGGVDTAGALVSHCLLPTRLRLISPQKSVSRWAPCCY